MYYVYIYKYIYIYIYIERERDLTTYIMQQVKARSSRQAMHSHSAGIRMLSYVARTG